MHDLRIYLSELNDDEIKILADQTSPKSFTTGDSAVPPIIHLSPAKEITDTNATIGYDLISYDGVRPEVILYWGSFDHGSNSGLWENSQSLGTREVGSGEFQIGGLTAGKEVFFQVRAIGVPFEDWADISGKFKTISKPSVRTLPTIDLTSSGATIVGEVTGNGGSKELIQLSSPKVSSGLLGHWRFDEGQGSETYDSTGLTPTATLLSGVTWASGCLLYTSDAADE